MNSSYRLGNHLWFPLEKDQEITQDIFISFVRGEEKGFAYFFHLYYKALHFFANKYVSDDALAEDIVEDSFVKFFERRASIQAAKGVKNFLYTTVRNACIDKIRQQKNRAGHNKKFSYLQNESETALADGLTRIEILSLVLKAIEELPPASRNVFKLYYLKGKGCDEIATELGRSIETVRNQKHYCLKVLRKKIEHLYY